jgi:putative hydrolase of the HAD superfamily
MVKHAFSHVDTWVFDLDNTLYPQSARLFDQIEVKMTVFVMEALGVDHDRANHLRAHYWKTYGTTLAGLMREHQIDPGPYLDDVHQIDLTVLAEDLTLRARIQSLPGRKVIYTNGPKVHAERVTAARGLSGIFDAVYGVEHAGFRPKPEREAFEEVFRLDGIEPGRAAMFEDDHRNLMAPHEMGMKCVLVTHDDTAHGIHVHHRTDDLSDFLGQLTGA